MIAAFSIGPSSKSFVFEKLKEEKLIDKNISKVVRTTRNDFALGTESGVYFCTFKDSFKLLGEPILPGSDVTELSEFALDQFVVGQWSANDFLIFDRQKPKEPKTLKQPLWCNALCTDLVPLPGYHPKSFPYYLSKTMRSLNLIDFKERKVHVLAETRDMPMDCFAFKKLCVTTTVDGRIRVLYVTSDREMQNTIVDEVTLGRYFMKGLHVAQSGWSEQKQPSLYSERQKGRE